MSEKIGYYKFRRMPRTERKAFKAAGGKVKLPLFTYFAGTIAMVIMLHSCDGEVKAPMESWKKAEAKCWNFVRVETGANMSDVTAGSVKDWKDGFNTRVNVKLNGINMSYQCFVDGNGNIVDVK